MIFFLDFRPFLKSLNPFPQKKLQIDIFPSEKNEQIFKESS